MNIADVPTDRLREIVKATEAAVGQDSISLTMLKSELHRREIRNAQLEEATMRHAVTCQAYLTAGEPFDEARCNCEFQVANLKEELTFYKSRCLCLHEHRMDFREPERTILRDVLANGATRVSGYPCGHGVPIEDTCDDCDTLTYGRQAGEDDGV
jgi:hypothetical protein